MRFIRIIALTVITISPAYSPLLSSDIELALGFRTGFYPEMGANLQTSFQRDTLNSPDGIYSINRTSDNVDTSTVKPILGRYAGITSDLIFLRRYILRTSINGAQQRHGGTGVTVNSADEEMKVKYSIYVLDLPLAFGLAVPFRNEMRFSLCAGFAPSYGKYANSFKSDSVSSKSSFTGWAVPIVIMFKAEYYVRERITVNSSLNYFRGATGLLRSKKDYSRIDFSSTRWDIGASYHFDLESKLRRGGIYDVE